MQNLAIEAIEAKMVKCNKDAIKPFLLGPTPGWKEVITEDDPRFERWDRVTKSASFVPYRVLGDGLRQIISEYKSAFSNLKAGNIKFFEMKFRSKHNNGGMVPLVLQKENFGIDMPYDDNHFYLWNRIDWKDCPSEKKKWGEEMRLYEEETKERVEMKKKGLKVPRSRGHKKPGIVKFGKLKYKRQGSARRGRKLPPSDSDQMLVREKTGAWYMLWRHKTPRVVRQSDELRSGISIDPGARDMFSFYSPDGKFTGTINPVPRTVRGKKKDGTRRRKTMAVADLLAKVSEITGENRTTLDNEVRAFLGKKEHVTKEHVKRLNLLRAKIKNKVWDTHNKTRRFLVDNFRTVTMGAIDIPSIMRSKKLNKASKRLLSTYSHCKFRDRLLEYDKHRAMCFVTEEYTSKTCTNCGRIDNNLGSNKVYNCDRCGITIDRDYNGARNIFIKSEVSKVGTTKPST
jgi:hypothetical protein